GTVFLVSADDEAVLVAVAARGAKVGMMLFEVRQAAAVVAAALRTEPEAEAPVAEAAQAPVHEYAEPVAEQPYSVPAAAEPAYAETALVSEAVEAVSEPAAYQGNGGGVADLSGWQSYAPGTALNGDSPSWS
ncbi:MAG: hypothetical protein QOE64_1047, partial [Frankiales bacterium]|nr:hypothetical protein [Frankiales bacterium]